jgi:general secretion pathway protein G
MRAFRCFERLKFPAWFDGPQDGGTRPDCRKPRHDCRSAGQLSDAGFTILEILVVITIIGLLIGLVAPAALRQLGGARVSIAKQSIERLGMLLDLYNLDMGSYPTSEQGLEALVKKPSQAANWNGPYIKAEAVPLDPWNQPYVYRSPSERPNHDYDLCSKRGVADTADRTMLCNP